MKLRHLLGWLCLSFCFLASEGSANTNAVKILVFSKTGGFRHSSIGPGILAIQQLGQTNNFTVDATEDSNKFTDANLAQYAAVVFLSTTGNDILNAQQKAAFERFIQSGKGYVGLHAASDTEYNWPWYADLVGAYFNGHPWVQPATIHVADRSHPSTENLPARWVRSDEWYEFNRNPRGNVHVLATIDETSYSGGGMGFDHPILWCHEYDGGRAWYTAGGHTDESFSEPLFRSHLLGGILWAAGVRQGDAGGSMESNFQKVVLHPGLSQPMTLSVAQDGRVLYIERYGKVYLYNPTNSSTVLAAVIPVYTDQEDGGLGIALDPNFVENNWVYILYSPTGNTPKQHVSRFTLVGDTIDMRSEKVVLQIPTQRDSCCHSAGSINFGPDGCLYIATGDNTTPFNSGGFSPIEEVLGSNNDAQGTSANGNDLRGKILRIKPQPDGTYTIPTNNLFAVGTPKTRPEIYVMGTRNPFRFSVDPATGWVYWGDIGPDSYSDDPNRGPKGYDEWNQARSAGNYGWPQFIADNQPYRRLNPTNGLPMAYFNAASPTNLSPNNTGPTVLPPARSAWLWYSYDEFNPMPEIGAIPHRTACAGPVYHYDAGLLSGRKFPSYFNKTVFLHDLYRNSLFEVKLDDAGNFMRMNRFLPNSFNPVIDMKFGPDGAMYVLEWLAGGDRLVRIDYVGGNYAPVGIATATPSNGGVPLNVQFSSTGTHSLIAGDVLTYAWSFLGDGVINSTNAAASYLYTQAGNYTARLTVTSSNGRQAIVNVPVSVGNTAPQVSIVAPPNGAFFGWNESIPYKISVTDAQDGATPNGIACGSVLFESALGHSEHSHTLHQVYGCEGSIVAPPADHGTGANLFTLLSASYVDAGAPNVLPLSAKQSVKLNPRRLEAEHGLKLMGVFVETTPDGIGREVSGIDHDDYITFNPVNLTNITRITARVRNVRGTSRIEARLGGINGTLVGTLALTPTTNYTDQFVNITAPVGTHELYLVFRHNIGLTDLFKLDYLEFTGSGVSSDVVLQAADQLGGAFNDSLTANIVEANKTITVPVGGASRFYRIRSAGLPKRIVNVAVVGGNVVLTYE